MSKTETATRRLVLHFGRTLVSEPIVCRTIKAYDLDFNIMKAAVTPDQEGLMVIEFSGAQEDLDQGVAFLERAGVRVQPLELDIIWNQARCTDCGACVLICPTAALYRPSPEQTVRFEAGKCIACELCIPACPPRAMEARY